MLPKISASKFHSSYCQDKRILDELKLWTMSRK